MKLSRNSKRFINYFLGPLIFGWLSWSIFNQVKKQPELSTAWENITSSFSGPAVWNLVAVMVLMMINWSLEAVKWRISVSSIQRVSFLRSFKAVLSGLSFAVSTPNRIGEYLGRMLYMDEGNRLRTISITIVGSISQLVITCLMGIAGLVAIRHSLLASNVINVVWFNSILIGIVVFTGGLLLFYFRLSRLTRWAEGIPAVKRYVYLVSAVDHLETSLLLKLLILSAFRFFIFIVQYALMLPLFAVELGFSQVFFGVSVAFLVMAVIPTVALIELPLRGKTMTVILGLFSINSLGIGLTAATMWLINLILPAIIGSLFMISQRKFIRL